MSTTDERDDGSIEPAHLKTARPETAKPDPAEGDDIVVIPAGPEDPERQRRRRAIYALGGVAVAMLIVGAIALVARNNGSSTATVQLSPTTVATKPISETHPTVPKTVAAPVVVATTAAPPTVPPQTSPPQTAVTQQTSPPATAPVVTPTIAVTKQYGASRLTWTAPSALRVASGGSVALAVVAHNPTDGTITLPHPLACTPRLDHGEMCTEMAQMIGSGQSASAQFTIDAHGVAPGNYTLRIEGVLTIPVTVS